MALVGYSDSEDSEDEKTVPAPAPNTSPKQRPSNNSHAPRKIKVNLPALAPELEHDELQSPPTKRARTAGTFSGFNSLLPPPKRTSAPKGVALKTSSEAAFSRHPLPVREDLGFGAADGDGQSSDVARAEKIPKEKSTETNDEPKIVGKTTRFKPLSVTNNRTKKPFKRPPMTAATAPIDRQDGKELPATISKSNGDAVTLPTSAQLPEAKKSLFSIHIGDDINASNKDNNPSTTTSEVYEPLEGLSSAREDPYPASSSLPAPSSAHQPDPHSPNPPSRPTSLQALASDLNLTASQKRQLLGRNGGNAASTDSIVHFDLNAEYAANAAAAAAGEVSAPTRAVRAIAPGKHSLKQLVDNARGQQDALEEKWAAGRAERGEAGGRYGWT